MCEASICHVYWQRMKIKSREYLEQGHGSVETLSEEKEVINTCNNHKRVVLLRCLYVPCFVRFVIFTMTSFRVARSSIAICLRWRPSTWRLSSSGEWRFSWPIDHYLFVTFVSQDASDQFSLFHCEVRDEGASDCDLHFGRWYNSCVHGVRGVQGYCLRCVSL